jgi:hypothetical protein
MVSAGSLLCPQKPSTVPYPEPDQSSPYHPILALSDPMYYYTPTYVLVLLVDSFLLAFPPISYMHSASPPIRATCPVRLILLDLIILIIFGEEYKLSLSGMSYMYMYMYARSVEKPRSFSYCL